MAETEEEKHNLILGANNVIMDTFYWSPVMTNTQGENSHTVLTSERRNNLDLMAETIKRLTLKSTINGSVCYN